METLYRVKTMGKHFLKSQTPFEHLVYNVILSIACFSCDFSLGITSSPGFNELERGKYPCA